MELKKEDILKQISELEQQREEKKADLSAIGGAIQVCKYWLGKIEAEEKKEPPAG